jgi:hypothetical protein
MNCGSGVEMTSPPKVSALATPEGLTVKLSFAAPKASPEAMPVGEMS